jgi:hypothetical protein
MVNFFIRLVNFAVRLVNIAIRLVQVLIFSVNTVIPLVSTAIPLLIGWRTVVFLADVPNPHAAIEPPGEDKLLPLPQHGVDDAAHRVNVLRHVYGAARPTIHPSNMRNSGM